MYMFGIFLEIWIFEYRVIGLLWKFIDLSVISRRFSSSPLRQYAFFQIL